MSCSTQRVLSIASLLLVAALPTATAHAAQRPNVVFILADDLGWGDPKCYWAASKIPTVHIDRLAGQGMKFTDAHSPTAVCTPTRYAFLTGRYAWRSWLKRGVLSAYAMPLLEPERVTLPEMLKQHGYATAAIGKWHLGMKWQRNDGRETPPHTGRLPDEVIDLAKPVLDGPCNHGFDSYFGTDVPNYPPFCFIENDRVFGPMPDRPKPKTMHGSPGRMQQGWRLERILPTLGQRAVAYIHQRAAKRDEPFFLYLPLTAPHTPIVPNPPFRGSTQATLCGDFVAEVDALVGDVLAALDETGLAENTIVVFTSDNGSPDLDGTNCGGQFYSCSRRSGHNPSGPWRGIKADIHEGGHRVPLIVRWPGNVRAGSVSEELICLVDFYATLAGIIGHELPDDAAEDSFNMLPALLEKKLLGPIRSSLIHHSWRGMFAIRSGPWKLIRGQGSGGFTKVVVPPDAPKGQLYHLGDDPKEQRNLYNDRPDVVERLSRLLDEQSAAGRTRP
jgi:arylsulfatase A